MVLKDMAQTEITGRARTSSVASRESGVSKSTLHDWDDRVQPHWVLNGVQWQRRYDDAAMARIARLKETQACLRESGVLNRPHNRPPANLKRTVAEIQAALLRRRQHGDRRDG